MDAFRQIDLHYGELTATEQKVADAVREDPESFLQSTSTMVAKQVGVSQSTVSRFCQKVGYESFSDFRMNLMVSLSANTPRKKDEKQGDPIDYLCNMIRATDESLKKGTIKALAEEIVEARIVYTTGGGLSSAPAEALSLELLKYNIPSLYIPTGQEMIQMHVADARDLVIIFSSKNDTQRMLLNVLHETAASRRPKTVMVAHIPTHPLRKLVDEFIVLPTWQTERYPVYIEPMTSMLAFTSILMFGISSLSERDPEVLPPIVNGKRLHS
ncbi:MAG: MurR/RpiR family transcriptional regulator [Tractidigestivibacter sp.]|jgi:DNA-binding MurR/RpiR family transcriptional regulator|uniref:MurR/RpiR family transcriptional regulator n=1 Tax=Tractidigestivibacter sp. TaxID=2847320 RepID=UPI003D8AC8F9